MILTFNEIMMSLEMGLIYGIVAIGIYLTFRIIDFPDLTCDGTFVLGSAVSAVIFKSYGSLFLSFIFAFLAGSAAGSFTGILYTRLKVTDLLSGILTGYMLYSINLRIMKMPNLVINSDFLLENAGMKLFSIACLVAFFMIFLLRTDFGLTLRAIGQNKRLSQNSGVHVKSTTVMALSLSNGIVALGGALFSQHQGVSDVGSGIGTVIVGLASVMIGESILPYRSLFLKIISCLLGSIIYRFLISLALHGDSLGVSSQDLNLVTGFLIMIILFIKRKNDAKT